MGIFDKLKKKEDTTKCNQVQNADLIKAAIQATCSDLVLFARDANLPYEIMHKYQKGMIIRERAFVDASAVVGGFLANHRYMILSNHMHMLPTPDKEWALCVANKDSRFLVLGKAEGKGKRITALLHLNNDTWQLFKSIDMSIFQNLLNDCYHSFKECVDKEPFPSVSSKEWLARCQFPIGMSDNGEFFPVDD